MVAAQILVGDCGVIVFPILSKVLCYVEEIRLTEVRYAQDGSGSVMIPVTNATMDGGKKWNRTSWWHLGTVFVMPS